MNITVEQLEACESTQDEVRARLRDAEDGVLVAVSTGSQQQGRGREGRRWQDPPGQALMVSVGRRGPLPVAVLADLPERVGRTVLTALDEPAAIEWKAPNDLVATSNGAKVGGILVDARTTGDEVNEVIIGLGINLTGPSFETTDGRAATSVESASGEAPDHADAVRAIVEHLAKLL